MPVPVILLIIIVLVAIIAALGISIYVVLRRKSATSDILRKKKRDMKSVISLLRVNTSKLSTFYHIVLPFSVDGDDDRTFKLPALIVNRGGVVVINYKDLHGRIDNPFDGDWRMFEEGSVEQIKNPVTVGGIFCNSIKKMLKEKDLKNVPVTNLVVYTERRVAFKIKIGTTVIPIDRLPERLHDINRERFLSMGEKIRVIRAIKDLALSYKK